MVSTQQLSRPAPPRSAWAAALANLTGLGLGYAYLRRWGRAVAAVAGTVVLVVVAFATHAANTPSLWRVIAAIWLALVVGDAARLARREPRPVGGDVALPVFGALAAVAALVGGYVGYSVAGHSTYAAGVAAESRGDCATAAPAFDAVTGPYELTLSAVVPAAAVRRAECAAFSAAGHEQDVGATADAETALRTFRTQYADSVLLPYADERLAVLALQRVDAAITTLRTASPQDRLPTTKAAFDTLLSVRRDLGDAPSAARVPQELQSLFAAAEQPFTDQRFCDALPTLDYLVTLPDTDAASIVVTARAHQAKSLLGCGLSEFRAGRFAQARDRMQRLVADHPGDDGEAQAKSVLIAADVAEKTGDPIPVPAPLGTTGPRVITFYNITSTAVRVELTGATAADITVPPCSSCPPTVASTFGNCPSPAGKPTQTVRLPDGLYHALLRPEPRDTAGNVRPFTAVDGDQYCVFATDEGPTA